MDSSGNATGGSRTGVGKGKKGCSSRNSKVKSKRKEVTAGLEEPQPGRFKSQMRRLDEEELRKKFMGLRSVHALIQRTKEAVKGDSDNQSFNDADAAVLMDVNDDEAGKDMSCGERCPKPLPKRESSGGQTSRMNRSLEVPPEEVKKMGTMIKSTMRQSLTANNAGVSKDDYYFLELDSDDDQDQDNKPATSASNNSEAEQTSSARIVYKQLRTAEDCELAWRHAVHPKINNKKWGAKETKRLKDIYDRLGNDWNAIAQELNVPTELAQKPGRTPYQCFFQIRNKVYPPKKIVWTSELDKQLLEKAKEHAGNWRLVAASFDDQDETEQEVMQRYKKIINPVIRHGPFTRVEDCLLLLTVEKLKPFLKQEGHFGDLLAYLPPWRYETTWRDRANNIFSDWIVPWTLEEDKMLLKLAMTMNRNWPKISEEFYCFKSQKGCLTRYKILRRRLKEKRFSGSLEAYHKAYPKTRYNVLQYKHLSQILQLLTKVHKTHLPPEHQRFPGLLRDREPTEVRLQHMLLTYDKDIMGSAIKSLVAYAATRGNYWKNWLRKHGKRKRTFDRRMKENRSFYPGNPVSVASALHIRRLKLKPKKDIADLNGFEEEIYKFYASFKRTKVLQQTPARAYIPDSETLADWPGISRLVEPSSVKPLPDVLLKRKWTGLKIGSPLGPTHGVREKIGAGIKNEYALSLRKKIPRGKTILRQRPTNPNSGDESLEQLNSRILLMRTE